MYTKDLLLDLHERGHRSLRKLLAVCGELPAELLNRELAGFGYPTVSLQLHHVIGGEEYWVGVIHGKMLVDENEADYASIAALEAYRARVTEVTRSYLQSASESELNTAREMVTWGGNTRLLVPGRILLRTLTHIYQHQGQVLAMRRLLGSPGPNGLDFPLD
jgi:uncharacterized damage-inducible protein DinB